MYEGADRVPYLQAKVEGLETTVESLRMRAVLGEDARTANQTQMLRLEHQIEKAKEVTAAMAEMVKMLKGDFDTAKAQTENIMTAGKILTAALITIGAASKHFPVASILDALVGALVK